MVLTLFAATAYPSANISTPTVPIKLQRTSKKTMFHLVIVLQIKRSVHGYNCFGRVCTYYTKNNYSALCAVGYADICFYTSIIPAASCQRCYDKNAMAVIDNLPASCELSHFNGHDFRTDDCAGAICTFYRDKGYGKDCKAAIAELCTNTGVIAPISCQSEKVHD